MKCTICNNSLVKTTLAGRTVYSCPVQHGIWFPSKIFNIVLQKLSLGITDAKSTVNNILKTSVLKSTNPNFSKKKCPNCSAVLSTYNYCYNSNIFFDKCNKCAGLWLDKNELETAVLYVNGDPELIRKSIEITRQQKGFRRNISNLPRVGVEPPCPAPLAKKIDFVRRFIEAQYDKPIKIILSIFAWDTIVILNHATSQIAEILITMCRLGPEGKRHAYYIILAIIAVMFSLIIFVFTL